MVGIRNFPRATRLSPGATRQIRRSCEPAKGRGWREKREGSARNDCSEARCVGGGRGAETGSAQARTSLGGVLASRARSGLAVRVCVSCPAFYFELGRTGMRLPGRPARSSRGQISRRWLHPSGGSETVGTVVSIALGVVRRCPFISTKRTVPSAGWHAADGCLQRDLSRCAGAQSPARWAGQPRAVDVVPSARRLKRRARSAECRAPESSTQQHGRTDRHTRRIARMLMLEGVS